MRTTRKLTLRREALAPLTTDELHALAGGEIATGGRVCIRVGAIATAVLLIATPHITNINCFADEA